MGRKLDVEILVERMIRKGHIIEAGNDEFVLGPKPPDEEDEDLRAFWKLLRDTDEEA